VAQRQHRRYSVEIPDNLTAEDRDLVESDLLPLVPRGSHKPKGCDGHSTTLSVTCAALLLDPEGKIVALNYLCGPSLRWSLPKGADAVRWTRHALRRLHKIDPDCFPILSPCADLPEYRTLGVYL
jgi:hypothetical protein